MYRKNIEHVQRHLRRTIAEVQAKIQDAPPGSQKHDAGLTFVLDLMKVSHQTLLVYRSAARMDFSERHPG